MKFTFVTKNIKPLILLVTKSQFVAKDLPIYMPLPYFISILSSQNIRTQPTPVRRNPTDANKHEPIRRRFTILLLIHHSVVADFTILSSPISPFRCRLHHSITDLSLPFWPFTFLPLTNPSQPFAFLPLQFHLNPSPHSWSQSSHVDFRILK